MEQEQTQQSETVSVTRGDIKKNSKGTIFSMIACIILGLGGIAFGVYEMTEVNKQSSEITDLKDKISVLEKTSQREEGYFYLEEWGLKVKIAEGEKYEVLGYWYDSDEDVYVDGSYGIFGGRYLPENSNTYRGYYPYLHEGEPSIHISRFLKEKVADYIREYNTLVFSDDKYEYYASMTNGALTNDNYLILAIKDFAVNSGFLKPENYSVINK